MKRLARQGQGVVQVEVGAGRRSMVELECYTGIPICVGVLRGRLEEVVNLFHFGGARSFRFVWISFLTLDLAWRAVGFLIGTVWNIACLINGELTLFKHIL